MVFLPAVSVSKEELKQASRQFDALEAAASDEIAELYRELRRLDERHDEAGYQEALGRLRALQGDEVLRMRAHVERNHAFDPALADSVIADAERLLADDGSPSSENEPSR